MEDGLGLLLVVKDMIAICPLVRDRHAIRTFEILVGDLDGDCMRNLYRRFV